MKALVVDDSMMMRSLVSRLLAQLSFAVTEARDGSEAVKAVEASNGDFDVIMLDWNMPVMNGYDALLRMKQSPKIGNAKVIMLTTENQIDNIRRALAAGAVEYVMKPFTEEMLIEKVKMVTENGG